MTTPPRHPPPNLPVEFDRDWDHLPLDELQVLDRVCDRFEESLSDDQDARIESFLTGLTEVQRGPVVRELVQLEVERRHARGQRPGSEEYAARFPQWAAEIHEVVARVLEEIREAGNSAAAFAETIAPGFAMDDTNYRPSVRPSIDPHQKTGKGTTETQVGWDTELLVSLSGTPWAGLPADGVLGQYRLQRLIGQGGMGIVVRAHDLRLGRDVAIKILSPDLFRHPNAKERFLREAREAAVVRHTNVVTIYAVEEIQNIPCLVMELIDGPTLEEHLRICGRLPVGETVSLAYQTAQGLAAAHNQRLIHRDIKPANILLEETTPQAYGLQPLTHWHARIADFGLARVVSDTGLTDVGLVAGTPRYMSPEQANGQAVDARSDLFSLGSVMYTMCAGRAAFEADSVIGILRLVPDKPAPSLRELSPETPEWLVTIIGKLMAKSPDDRFQSAAEVVELLGHHIHDLQMEQSGTNVATFATPTRATTVPASQWRRFVTLGALMLVCVAVRGHGDRVFEIQTSGSKSAIRSLRFQISNLRFRRFPDLAWLAG